MMMGVPPSEWSFVRQCSVEVVAGILTELASRVPVERMLRCRRGPKRPRPKRSSGKRNHHVSNKKLLDQAQGIRPPKERRGTLTVSTV
jgi:hypothetical protein